MADSAITLTPRQQDALDWIVQCIVEDAPLVALRGLAGTGKTSLLPALRAALAQYDLPTVIGAPTHRAAMILRRKGIADADTVHSLALTPYFDADYRRAAAWLGATMPAKLGEEDAPHDDVEGLPWLVWHAVEPDATKGRDVKRQARLYGAKRALTSVGIHGKQHFAGFGPKQGEGVLIIDEASMVGQKMLETCQQAYQHIILVGDPGQLPPVKDVAQLASADGVDLTEIHRQAGNSPIIQLAYQARKGMLSWPSVWREPYSTGDDVASCSRAPAAAFLESPLIVWRNLTRIDSTHAIRAALGFAKDTLYPGEPLVCRSTSQEDRAEGFYNNGLYRVLEVDGAHARRVVVEDALGETSSILAHLEELDGDWVDPRAIPFRFGYCLTAHTAQGGEWPTVYISLPDLLKYAEFCRHRNVPEELAQWAYTAITRAKTTLRFLAQHHFLTQEEATMATPKPPTIAPPSSPLMGMPVDKSGVIDTPLAESQDGIPTGAPPLDPLHDDDIPEVVAPTGLKAALIHAVAQSIDAKALAFGKEYLAESSPPSLPATFGEHEALLQGFCQHLLARLTADMTAYGKEASIAIDAACQYLQAHIHTDKERLRHAETLLDSLVSKAVSEGIQLRHDPYVASVRVRSPEGFDVTIQMAKGHTGELITALIGTNEEPGLLGWLKQAGYTPLV